MTWARVDDGWWCHPKVLTLDLDARGLWVSALSWSCQQKTSHVPTSIVHMCGDDGTAAKKLVAAGLWDETDGGWRIHDWDDLQYESRPARPWIPRSVRASIYERDGWRCVHCGATDRLSLDHIVPFARGGTDSPKNMQTLCQSCNRRKGTKTVDEMRPRNGGR